MEDAVPPAPVLAALRGNLVPQHVVDAVEAASETGGGSGFSFRTRFLRFLALRNDNVDENKGDAGRRLSQAVDIRDLAASQALVPAGAGAGRGKRGTTRYCVVRITHRHEGVCCCGSSMRVSVYDIRSRTSRVTTFTTADLALLGAPVWCSKAHAAFMEAGDGGGAEAGGDGQLKPGALCGMRRLLPWLVMHLELNPALTSKDFVPPSVAEAEAKAKAAQGGQGGLVRGVSTGLGLATRFAEYQWVGSKPTPVAVVSRHAHRGHKVIAAGGLASTQLLRCCKRIPVVPSWWQLGDGVSPVAAAATNAGGISDGGQVSGVTMPCLVSVQWCDRVSWPSPWLLVWVRHVGDASSGAACPVSAARVQSLRHLVLRKLTFRQRQAVAWRVVDSLVIQDVHDRLHLGQSVVAQDASSTSRRARASTGAGSALHAGDEAMRVASAHTTSPLCGMALRLDARVVFRDDGGDSGGDGQQASSEGRVAEADGGRYLAQESEAWVAGVKASLWAGSYGVALR